MHGLLAEGGSLLVAQMAILSAWSAVWPYLVMLLGFSAIVFVHELGHFAVAKWAGVRVDRFAIGFGRELFGFTKGETRYSFNILPLGGYVKMLGQEDFDEKSNELKFKEDPHSFANKPVGHRMAIVSAGVIMNVLFACLLFGVVFMVGMDALGTRIGNVEPESPAHKAGLLAGDEIVAINGEGVLEFRDVLAAVMLAAPHEPIAFTVRRNGELQRPIHVIPDYRRPETTRDLRRQVVGISPGGTREIIALGPEIDGSKPDQPRVGDLLAEVDGTTITDANASVLLGLAAHTEGDVFVERPDPKDPKAPKQKVKVDIAPRLTLFPSDRTDAGSLSLLGLTPLVRFDAVEPRGRADLAGIEAGDAILMWDDQQFPNRADVTRAVHENSEQDISYRVRKANGKTADGFIRPQENRRGPATVQAVLEAIPEDQRDSTGAKVRFNRVRPYGIAARAGIEQGDLVIAANGAELPTASAVMSLIREGRKQSIELLVRRGEKAITARLVPKSPGSIDASFDLAAEDIMQVGRVVATLNSRPSPAAEAGIPDGVRILGVNGKPVGRWRDLIREFRASAGSSVALECELAEGTKKTATMKIPPCVHTLVGIGPEARIVKIDGKESVSIPSASGSSEEVFVAHHEGLRTILTQLSGQKQVPVEFRRNALSDVETKYIDVTEDMTDPWLARVALTPSLAVGAEMKRLQGENVADAVWIGVHKTYYFILQVYEYMNRMIFSRTVSAESMSGPLGIVDTGGKLARAGWVDFLFFLAIISANLAVINFLPLPIVDGGLMVFLIIEKIKGSPVSLKVQVATQAIGLFLIIGMFLFVTYNDVVRMFG